MAKLTRLPLFQNKAAWVTRMAALIMTHQQTPCPCNTPAYLHAHNLRWSRGWNLTEIFQTSMHERTV